MSEKNPWKKVSSKIVYQNPWIRVREDEVIRPDGLPGIYSVVETRIATGVIALTEKDEVYLVGQFRYALDEYSWEIIEGGSDPDEDPLQTAMRELKEEAGLIAKSWEALGGEIQLTNCHSSEIGRLFLARDLEQTEAQPDGTEVLRIRKVPFEQCLEMADRGIFKDAMSIIALYRLQALRQGRQLG